MERTSGHLLGKLTVCLLLIILAFVTGAWARPTTPEEARNVVTNWLGLDSRPLEAGMSPQVQKVRSYPGPDGITAYYVVFLNPAGLVIVPADDLVEPIIGFLPAKKTYNPSPGNPLGALVSKDVSGRVIQARGVEAISLKTGESLAPENPQAKAQRKWAWLADPVFSSQTLEFAGLPHLSSVRVSPFVRSRWSQTRVKGEACYNYYTPPDAAGSPTNYPSGCVATAMSQLMRYFRRPFVGVGTAAFNIAVDGVVQSANLRGGDGSGGPYHWADMVLRPSSPSNAQRQAIGALLHDAGLSVNMSYYSGGSAANTLDTAYALTSVFGYKNARAGYNYSLNLPADERNLMVNPNLHARYPVILGITGDGGHAILCDGYGYQAGTMYHHLNMGWAGSDDAWYNLPDIDTTNYSFTSVYKCVYNVYFNGTGEIIAGRVSSVSGGFIEGATVTATIIRGATPGVLTRTATTDSRGIFALVKMPAGKKYSVSVSKPGYTFATRTVTLGTSLDYTTTTGNRWKFNFRGTPQ